MRTADDWIRLLCARAADRRLAQLTTDCAKAAGARIGIVERYCDLEDMPKEERAHLHLAILSIELGTAYEMLNAFAPGTFDETGLGPLAKAIMEYEP